MDMTIALLGTILSNQDGFGRMFADGTKILLMPALKKKTYIEEDSDDSTRAHIREDAEIGNKKRWLTRLLIRERLLRHVYAGVVCAALPLITCYLVKDPVDILSVAGSVAAVHTPVVVFLTLYLNRTRLPKRVRPGLFFTLAMWVAGLAYGAFAVYYVFTLGGT